MAKVYDLSSYLEEKAAVIKIGNEEFAISDGFNDMLKIDALSQRRNDFGSVEFVQEFLKIALGEETATKLIERNYRTKVYIEIMNCINDAYTSDAEKEGVSPEVKPELV